MDHAQIRELATGADTKVVLLVMDGLGGLAREPGGQTELETARTPNLDRLAAEGICGMHEPVGPGITPGSGPGHLALFGYDPLRFQIGRGVLSALGSDFDLQPQDVAARGNFCTMGADGKVTDRRAGRISTEENQRRCELLSEIKIPGVELFVQPVKEHRFLLVMRGEGLSGALADTDPQQEGRKPLEPRARSEAAGHTAELVKSFIDQAREKLAGQEPANMVLMRGFAMLPDWPRFPETFGVRAAGVADYPMYRGVAKLVGMDAVPTPSEWERKIAVVQEKWNDYDFFFVHVKPVDSRGEDGDFDAKVRVIEEVDRGLPQLLDLKPDVLVVTGDHSTPAVMKSHSWHSVPMLLWGKRARTDVVQEFGERACMTGGLGARLHTADLMTIAMAHAGRIEKFGA